MFNIGGKARGKGFSRWREPLGALIIGHQNTQAYIKNKDRPKGSKTLDKEC
jgi:hypothetical protein